MFALFLWCLFFLWLGAIYNELLLVFCFLIEMSTQRCTVSQVLGKKKRPQSPKSPCCRALKIVCSEFCLSRIINYRISSVLIKCQKKISEKYSTRESYLTLAMRKNRKQNSRKFYAPYTICCRLRLLPRFLALYDLVFESKIDHVACFG